MATSTQISGGGGGVPTYSGAKPDTGLSHLQQQVWAYRCRLFLEPGNEAGEWSLGTRLGSGAWERGWGVEPGNEAGEWSLGTRLESGAWERGWGVEPGNVTREWSLGTRVGIVCTLC